MLRNLLVFTAALAVSAPAMADQCAWNAKPVTQKAVDILSHTKLIQSYCASCGDKAATAITVKKASLDKTDDPNMFVAKVNDDEVDLAYTFVPKPTNAKIWTNLGLLVNCDEAGNIDTKELTPDLVAK